MVEVSIIITHYQRIAKLYQQLNEYKNWQKLDNFYEFIVVDDNSLTDRQQVKILKDFPWLKLINLKTNGGPSIARNVGIKNAKGRFIQFIDDDDLITYDKLLAQHAFLISNSKIDVIIGGSQKESWNENELPLQNSSKIEFPAFETAHSCSDLIKTECFFPVAAALFKIDCLLKIGGFNEERSFIEDVHLYLRLLKANAKIKVNKNLPFGFFWRIGELSLSKSNDSLFLEGCLLNYIFCVENDMMVNISDYIVVYSGIYNILKQSVNLPTQTGDLAHKLLDNLNFKERLKYLPKEASLSLLVSYHNLFKLFFLYRQIKNCISKK